MPLPIYRLPRVGPLLVAAALAPAAVRGSAPEDTVVPLPVAPLPADGTPDPLAGTPWVDPATSGVDAERALATMLPPRTDSPRDWQAPIEPLHDCGEPRALPPCVPPPPCHPSMPPAPYDLVGVRGEPSGGPIYEGPCAPRTGTHDDCPHPHVHRLSDRFFDAFYMWK